VGFAFLFGLVGCDGGSDPPPFDGGSDPPFDGHIVLTDENNYTYVSRVDIASVEVTAGQDADVDWTGLTTDIQGHPIDGAEDVDEVYLTRFGDGLTEEGIEELIAGGMLLQEHIQATFLFENAESVTANRLTDFAFFGSEFIPADYLLDDDGVWTIALTSEGIPSPRVSTFVAPRDDSANDRIEIGDASGSLEFTADLASSTAIGFREVDSYEIDWSGLTVNGLGNEIDFSRIEEMLIGRFEGMTVEELQTRVLDLELIAAEKYTLDVRGDRSADPASAADEGGAPFPGFGSGTLWLVVLRCSGPTCTNPAPAFLGVLNVL